jgi:hypothetical protein
MRVTHVTVDALIILRILDNLKNFLACAGNVGTRPTNENGIFRGGFACLDSKFDGESLVLTNDSKIDIRKSCVSYKMYTYAFRVVPSLPMIASCQCFST